MNILNDIIAYKKEEVAVRKLLVPQEELMDSFLYNRKTISLRKVLEEGKGSGIIAEFKRRSPSKGVINQHADIRQVTRAYTQAGASALSILTDNHFFGGGIEDMVNARENEIPILRKDFVIDAYQVYAAKAIGADVVLLIASCLSRSEVKELAAVAKEIGLEVMLEIHGENQLEHVYSGIDMVAVNNRNLKNFEVDINHSISLGKLIPSGIVKIAESGITDVKTIDSFREHGYKGFLMGERFMKESDPGKALKDFITEMKNNNR